MEDLDIRISAGSDETKTQQIFNQIAAAILAGKVNRGDALTSERALAARLGVSRNIVRNAYRRLEEQGLVEAVSTAGRRVRSAKRRSAAGVAGVERGDALAMQKAEGEGKRQKAKGKRQK
ncbi:MAG TPA: winged helix-turn-helix domain-containing protein [Pyrinomonadaceae bacterium]|nr:winged helix-turn-helix domain-containing protein [Pyrinomonadaceae bacterium]